MYSNVFQIYLIGAQRSLAMSAKAIRNAVSQVPTVNRKAGSASARKNSKLRITSTNADTVSRCVIAICGDSEGIHIESMKWLLFCDIFYPAIL